MTRFLSAATWHSFWQHTLEVFAARGLLILVLLIAYMLARMAVNRVIDAALARLLEREHRHGDHEDRANRLRTLQGLTKSIAGYVLLFVLIIMLLDAVGANVAGIITTAGVGGIALGFGAQKLVKDVISGFFLIMEDQFAVGDYVTIGGATGVVEDLGMRITRVRDDSGRLWILANGDISVVTNHSRAPVESSVEIGLAPAADVAKAQELISEACESLHAESPGDLHAAPKVKGVSGWDSTHVLVRVGITTAPRHLAAEQLRVREAIHRKLVEAGIPIA